MCSGGMLTIIPTNFLEQKVIEKQIVCGSKIIASNQTDAISVHNYKLNLRFCLDGFTVLNLDIKSGRL
jgi:hypothetical protein